LSIDHASSKGATMHGQVGVHYMKILNFFFGRASHRNFVAALCAPKGAAKVAAKLSLRLRGVPLKGTAPLPPPR